MKLSGSQGESRGSARAGQLLAVSRVGGSATTSM